MNASQFEPNEESESAMMANTHSVCSHALACITKYYYAASRWCRNKKKTSKRFVVANNCNIPGAEWQQFVKSFVPSIYESVYLSSDICQSHKMVVYSLYTQPAASTHELRRVLPAEFNHEFAAEKTCIFIHKIVKRIWNVGNSPVRQSIIPIEHHVRSKWRVYFIMATVRFIER